MRELNEITKKFLFRIGSEVSNLAKERHAPIVTGKLKRNIAIRSLSAKKVTIGHTNVMRYAKYVYFGTGIHGVQKRKITPKKAKALKTPFGYRKSVKGQKANPYLEKALDEYMKRGGFDRAIKDLSNEVGRGLAKHIIKSFDSSSF